MVGRLDQTAIKVIRMIVVRYLTRILASCLLLLSVPLVPATSVHADAASPIFPPASVFEFTSAVVDGSTKVGTLPKTDWAPQAIGELDYSVSSKDILHQIGYEVSMFRSQADAMQYDKQLRMDPHNNLMSIAHPVVPGEWLRVNMHLNYVDIGAGLVYRNLELNVGTEIDYSNQAYKKQQQIAQQAILPVIAMEVRLLARAQAFAAHPVNLPAPTPPIFPPDSVFMLPPNAVRQPVKGVSEAYQLPAKVVDQAFGVFAHQHSTYSYFVTTFRSSTDAIQNDGNTKSGNHGYTLLRIQQPVTPGEWLKEDANVPPDSGTNGGPYGAISVGLVYRNLSMIVYVYVEYHDAPATKTSRMSQATQIALDTASQLYSRAQAFAAHQSPELSGPTGSNGYAAVHVLFTGKGGNVYMMDANGNNRSQLTTLAGNGSGVSYPWYAWSPDHKYILLVRSHTNASSDLLLFNQNGNLLSTLATGIPLGYPAFYPTWAIDDDVIAYVAAKQVSATNSCDVTLFVSRVNVQGIKTPLWKYPDEGCSSGAYQTSNAQASDLANNELPGYAEFFVHWSVKPQYAVYFGKSSLQVTNWQTGATAHFPQDVYDALASPSGSIIAEVSDNKVVLYRDKPFLTVQGMSPVWSPDSRFLYVERCQTNNRCAIFKVEVAQGHATQLVPWQNVYSFGPLHVTSDGHALIFSRIDVTGPQQAQVSIQRLDVGGLTTLATNASRPAL